MFLLTSLRYTGANIIVIIINIKDWISLIRSVSRVTTVLANVSSVFQLFSFLVVCSGMIATGFGFVAFFAKPKLVLHYYYYYYYYYYKSIFAYCLPGGSLPVSPALHNRSKRFTPALTNVVCSAH